MNTQHTPSPWKIATFDGPNQYASVEAGNEINELVRVCDIPSWPCAIEEMQANAFLISAAPDMFDALQAVCDAYGDRDTLLIAQCKAALAKAKGEA